MHAQTLRDAQKRIELRNSEIAELEREIRRYQSNVAAITREKRTLENEIALLEMSERKLNADIRLSRSKIALAETIMRELRAETTSTELKINLNKEALADALRAAQRYSGVSLVEIILRHETISEYWTVIHSLQSFKSAATESLENLARFKIELEKKQLEQRALKEKETALRKELEVRAGLVVANKEEQARILAETRNQESAYQTLLADRRRLKREFQEEIRRLESGLNLKVDAGSIPSSGPGVLAWPVEHFVITQYFGNTAFATSNPQIYNGGGHNGIDLGVAVGTPVRSAATGVVIAVGDTDLVCRNASYGRWILVRHTNGLSTLYAHLSHIGVSPGQSVARGEVIAFSGNTGFSTGPHLHFTVYASGGVQVRTIRSRSCGGRQYTLPLADRSAYLNPLSFL